MKRGVLVVVLIAVLGACSSGASHNAKSQPATVDTAAESALVRAVRATLAEKSAHLSSAVATQNLDETVTGDVELDGQGAQLAYNIRLKTTTEPNGPFAVEAWRVAGTLYVKLPPGFPGKSKIHTPWMSFDAKSSQSTAAGYLLLALPAIAAAHSNANGSYTGTINLQGSITRLPVDIARRVAVKVPNLDRAVTNLIGLVGNNPSFVATLDDHGRLASVTLHSDVPGLDNSLQIGTSKFGVAVHVNAPPAADVTPAPADQSSPL